jgi:hypothetical protein
MKKSLLVLLSVALAVLTGCTRDALVEKMAPEDVKEASKRAISDLKERRFDALKGRLGEELKGQDLDEAFEKMAGAFPNEEAKTVSPIGFYASTGTAGTRFDISYKYQYSKEWVLARLSWRRVNGQLRIISFNVSATDNSAVDVDAFTFKGKGPFHYLVVLLAAFVLSLSVVSLVQCIRTRNLRRKWAWILFIIFGLGTFSFNWTTAEWRFALIHIQLLSVGAVRLSGSPWMITIAIPVGAVAFLDKLRRQRIAREAAALAEGVPPLI